MSYVNQHYKGRASEELSLPLIIGGLALIFKSMLMSYNGNIEIYVPAEPWHKPHNRGPGQLDLGPDCAFGGLFGPRESVSAHKPLLFFAASLTRSWQRFQMP